MIKAASHSLLGIALLASFAPLAAQDNAVQYPFERFVGEWKLKNDTFQQVWDRETVQTVSIPGHRTRCEPVNTQSSILCVVDAVDFQGHILWAANTDRSVISHLSHFGQSRLGQGAGTMNADGDLSLSIRFSDEPEGTYRHYVYRWISPDEYHMHSRQLDAQGEPTGNWYGGTFVRVPEDG